MEPILTHSPIKKLLYILAGLSGISIIILIHEAGHFLFAKLFNVPTPIFSLGFGPTLFEFPIDSTLFKIALLPIGGYVEMDPEILDKQNYFAKMLIILGGIVSNFIFAYSILFYYTIRSRFLPSSTLSSSQAMKQAFSTIFTQQNGNNTFVGPIGIIRMIGQSIAINSQFYWFALAIISFNIGFLNIIPLPFFDGGKALLYTLEIVFGIVISPSIIWLVSTISLTLLCLFLMQITMNDIKKLINK